MAFTQRDELDDNGVVHIRKSGSWPGFPLSARQANGKIDDISANALFFELVKLDGSILRKALTANPTDPSGRLVPQLSPAECAELRAGGEWAIWDETSGQRLLLASGLVEIYG
jgi:hypothetical protein